MATPCIKEIISFLRIEETARERRKSREGGSIRESTESAANDVELESLLDDPEDGPVENTEAEQQELSNNVEEESNDVEEEIPIEIPLDDLPVRRTEEEEAAVVTKAEPLETSEANEQVIERPLERVPIEPPLSPAEPQRRLTEDDPNMDSMDRLRRDLEKLANKGRGSGTEARPLRKTGAGPEDTGGGGEEEEVGETEVKQEGTWYCKPPMSPELLIAIAVRNLDPHKEVSCH